MRASSLTLAERRRVLLDQASAALHGQVVGLWRLVSDCSAVAEVVSRPLSPRAVLDVDFVDLLRRWGRSARPSALWVGCQVTVDQWHIAEVRCGPPAPPPTGVERRSPERLVVDLVALCLGGLERIWVAADQVTVYLCSALDVLDSSLGRVRRTDGLTTRARARLLADLAGVADAIENALTA